MRLEQLLRVVTLAGEPRETFREQIGVGLIERAAQRGILELQGIARAATGIALERERAFAKGQPAATLAKRFAAKEACAKALGTGFRKGTYWRDMGVVNLPSGRPTLALTGGAKEHLDRMTPAGYEARIDLTLTDEEPLASAVVIISATPKS